MAMARGRPTACVTVSHAKEGARAPRAQVIGDSVGGDDEHPAPTEAV